MNADKHSSAVVMNAIPHTSLIGCMLILCTTIGGVALADSDVADQAKLAQNPVAAVISIPFQNNTDLNFTPDRSTLNVLNVQPVVPFSLTKDWNVITRAILPLISSPTPGPGDNRTNGTGDLVFTAFLSPAHQSGWLWGIGPAVQAPTHSEALLGNDDWGLGPSFAVVHLEGGSPWVYGAVVNNIWSVSSSGSRAYSNGYAQLFANYNMRDGWYVVSAPTVTVDWNAPRGQRWTVPVGGGVGKLVHWDRLPVNIQLAGYYNAARPSGGPNWQIRSQVQFLFPK